ncbi:hypothetical protein T4D_9703, partial [Trichinella pseudospiralis]
LSTVRFRILRIHRTQGIPDRYFRGPCLELLYHLTNDITQAPLLDLLPSLDCLGFISSIGIQNLGFRPSWLVAPKCCELSD